MNSEMSDGCHQSQRHKHSQHLQKFTLDLSDSDEMTMLSCICIYDAIISQGGQHGQKNQREGKDNHMSS